MNARQAGLHQVEESGLFDEAWYRRRYPDVDMLGISPVEHFVRIGAAIGRDPGPDFSTSDYVRVNPELSRDRSVNPLLHYLSRVERTQEAEPAPDIAGDADATRTQESAVRAAFDDEFYLACHPEVAHAGADPFEHYMKFGWKLGWDPVPHFSTNYYLQGAPDVRRAGINPFPHYIFHGKREGRASQPFHRMLDAIDYEPLVTAVIPNYNHERFLEQRIDSILNQKYENVEILVLDDASDDDSRSIITDYCERFPDRVRAVFNDDNSGNVFRQWRKGVEMATGELLWICESDDFCDSDFLTAIVPHFKDRSVNIAFGRIQFADVSGGLQAGLDQYREGAEPGIWEHSLVRPANQWFANGFGVNNVIANVGGSVWRRQDLPADVWEEAQTYSILGDWFLYCIVAGGGQIAYEPEAVAYFRQHGGNTSVSSFRSPPYYQEHQRLMTTLREHWDVPAATVDAFVGKVQGQYRHLGLEETLGRPEEFVDRETLMDVTRRKPHILIAFLGFHPGGGEAFPINLANALRSQGWQVSMLAYDAVDENEGMRASLSPGIAIYYASQVEEMGVHEFLANAGVSLIHSHMATLEYFFIEKHDLGPTPPYLVSLHGSYEASDMPDDRLRTFANRVDHWIFTAEKNLIPFAGVGLDPQRFSKIPNGMASDPRPFPSTRKELGIAEDALVFTFVARGVAGKGWLTAPEAFQKFRDDHPERPMHLLMCGTGDEADRAQEEYGHDPDISFLGYVTRLGGLYRLSDCALVPTRFAGESAPLCVIQAMQAGTPVIATRMGDIEEMISPADQSPAGIMVEFDLDDTRFDVSLRSAMEGLLDADRVRSLSAAALEHARRYDISRVADAYGEVYRRLMPHGPTAAESGSTESSLEIPEPAEIS